MNDPCYIQLEEETNAHAAVWCLVDQSPIPGLKKAIDIAENRLRTAAGIGYNESYQAAYEDILVFLRAELWRQENPEEAKKTRTILD